MPVHQFGEPVLAKVTDGVFFSKIAAAGSDLIHHVQGQRLRADLDALQGEWTRISTELYKTTAGPTETPPQEAESGAQKKGGEDEGPEDTDYEVVE